MDIISLTAIVILTVIVLIPAIFKKKKYLTAAAVLVSALAICFCTVKYGVFILQFK